MRPSGSKRWERYRGAQGTRRRVRALARRLERVHGPFQAKSKGDPVAGLVQTILSQATSDHNSTLAFERLKARFPHWNDLLEAPVEELEAAIRPGGLSHNKARTIREVLTKLRDRPEGWSLDHLSALPVSEAIDQLRSLPGVGVKTASCVLLFDLGRPVMPVDTHVHRLSRRLGLADQRATAEQTFEVLMAIIPPELICPVHLWLIAHGRAVCLARRPRCRGCSLADLCPSRSV